jgi:hypothetical protein
MTPELPWVGGCNCGAVRYRAVRAPLTAYICHCHLCQKRCGSAFSLSMVFPDEAVEFTAGEPQCTERVAPDGACSALYMCGACHSRIHTRWESRPGLNLRASTLDDTSWVRPVAQFWTSSAQPWAIVPGILCYAQQPNAIDYADMLEAWRRSAGAD